MDLVLLDDGDGVEGVLLGELGLDLLENGAEVRRVLSNQLASGLCVLKSRWR